jgi:vacuolar-type H+-ATPase subunit I/STV1
MIEFIVGTALGVVGVLLYRQTQRGKKAFHKKQLRDTIEKVWAFEFIKYSSMMEREKVRLQYDQAMDYLQRVKAQDKPDKEQVKKAEQQIKELKSTLDKIETMLEGEGGANQTLEGQVQKREYIKSFIKYNC